MAENTTTTSTARKAPARKSSPKRKPSAARRASTTRSTAAKSPSTATGRRSRTIARNETREAAQANVRAAKTTAKQGRNVAERVALVYVGATLEARDRAAALVNDLPDATRLERRGTSARKQLERDVRKARTRLERELRGRRRDAERIVRRNRAQVGGVVQSGVSAAKERVTAIA